MRSFSVVATLSLLASLSIAQDFAIEEREDFTIEERGDFALEKRDPTTVAVPCSFTYTYVGCAAEPFYNGQGSDRALTGNYTAEDDMTLQICSEGCADNGWTYFGVEYATQCFCGSKIENGTTMDPNDANCNMACGGNATQTCGGGGHMNLYHATKRAVCSGSSTTHTTTHATTTSTSTVVITTHTTATSMPTPTTPSTTTHSSTSRASKTHTSASHSPTSTLPANFFSLDSCPSFAATLGPTWLRLPATYTPYYNGSGYTQSTSNPGNIFPYMFRPRVFNITGSYTACQAAQACVADLAALNIPYLSFDLHYRSPAPIWKCIAYVGTNSQGSYFNVPNTAVKQAYGFSAKASWTQS